MYWTSVTTIGANVVVGADVVEGAAVTGTLVVELSLVTTSVGRAVPEPSQSTAPTDDAATSVAAVRIETVAAVARAVRRFIGSPRAQAIFDGSCRSTGRRSSDGRGLALSSIVVRLVKVPVLQLDADRCLL